MSTTSGSNLEGNNFVLVSGVVHAEDGAKMDVTTEAGLLEAQNRLSAEQLADLEAAMKANGYELKGARWVPNDSMMTEAERAARAERRTAQGLDNAADVTDGMTELDLVVSAIFQAADLPNPYNANTTPQLFVVLEGTPEFEAMVQAVTRMAANNAQAMSTEPNSPVAAQPGSAIHGVASDFAGRFKTEMGQGNIMEALFLVFRQSIKQTNEDKKYFLKKLQEYNIMAEQLSDYLSELVEESQALSSKAAGAKYPEKVTHPVTVKSFDTSTLNSSGEMVQMSSATKNLDRAGLNDTIKDVESMQETIRNKRQMASTAFQNFDQKANQLYNLMSSVLKVMNEMRSGTTRNML